MRKTELERFKKILLAERDRVTHALARRNAKSLLFDGDLGLVQ